MISMIKYY